MRRSSWRAAAACLLLMMAGAIGTGAAAQTLAFQAAAGDYIVGSVRALNADTLLLRGPGGEVLRRFAAGSAESEFRFVLASAGPHTLALSGPERAGRTLQILEQVPLAGQRDDAAPRLADFDSPQLQAWARTHGAGSEAFWAAATRAGIPLVEPIEGSSGAYRVTFLWRGASTRSVRLFWPVRQGDQERFARHAGSDVWHYSVRLPGSTRLGYQFAPDVPQLRDADRLRQRRAILATVQADPLNPRRWNPSGSDGPGRIDDVHVEQSVLELPDAPPEPWLAARPGVPRGTLQTLRYASARLGNERELGLYLPPDYTPTGAPLPLLLLFDHDAYVSRVPTPTILDNLIAAGRIPPLVAVLVGNPTRDSRTRELPCNAEFADMLAGELLPWLQARWRITADPARTVVAGSSYGGLASAWLGFRHPGRFGRVLSLSGSYWWSPERPPGRLAGALDDSSEGEWLTRQYASAPRSEASAAVRFFISAGLLERSAPADGPGILETNRHLRDVLRARGQVLHYREFAGGHDYIHWRNELADGLMALLGDDPDAKR